MVRHVLSAALVLVAVGAAGCIVICTEKVERCPRPVSGPTDPTIAEIDAVGKLAFDNDRRDSYRRIAERPGLSDAAQVYLVHAACSHLEFEDARTEVLVALAENPCFGPVGRAALLERLDCLTFEHNKRKILELVGTADSP